MKLADGGVIPALYALLPSKCAKVYRRLLDVVFEALDGCEPQAIHVDFEVPMIEELEKVFPSSGILGCGFHFNQCLWRKIQGDKPLLELFSRNSAVSFGMRMFGALAYVPPNDVRQAFEMVLSFDFVRSNETVLRTFINYYEGTWVGRDRNPPKIKLEWWNLYNAVRGGLCRSNNQIEGWHSSFNARVEVAHPTVSTLINHLKLQQGQSEFVVCNAVGQGRDGGPRPVEREKTARLEELVASYHRRALADYIQAAAHCIKF